MIDTYWFSSLLEINLYLISLTILWLLIRNKISFWNQRVMLLAIPPLSYLILWIKNPLYESGMVYEVIPLNPVDISTTTPIITDSFEFQIEYVYWFGVFVFLSVFVIKILRILAFFKDAESDGRIVLLNSSTEDSFSFFNLIHIRANLDKEEQDIVLAHELIHLKKYHSLDLILFEVYHSLFWFNPLLILMKKELIHIHEFEVDQEMYSKHKTKYLHHLLNYALGSSNSHYLLSSQFYNKLTLKKRIATMKNSNKSNNILFLLSLPVLAITFMVTSCESQDIQPDNQVNQQMTRIPPENGDVPSPPPPPIPEEHVQKGELTKMPEFPGGQEAMFAYMGENIKYPKQAKEDEISGKVLVNFTVKNTGEIAYVKVVKGVSPELDNEAIRVIKHMPDWTPGEIDGKQVSSQLTLPINFKLK
ncbi:TonB family protein [bacterium SCSIO 12643]|nr:TonB family protein [bacterium SCSIO 12643]